MWKRLSDLTKRYWSFFICVLLCSAAAECIGPIRISFGKLTITFLPLLYAMIFMLIFFTWQSRSAAWERLSCRQPTRCFLWVWYLQWQSLVYQGALPLSR